MDGLYPPQYLESVYTVRTKEKEERAIRLLSRFINHPQIVATLSGKDSLASLHLAARAGATDTAVISAYIGNRRLPDHVIDELAAIAKTLGARVVVHNEPWDIHATLFRIISSRYGYNIIITGLRRRENRGHTGVTEYYTWGMLLNPIIDWTAAEVWSYIYRHGLPIPSPYSLATRPETPLQHLVF